MAEQLPYSVVKGEGGRAIVEFQVGKHDDDNRLKLTTEQVMAILLGRVASVAETNLSAEMCLYKHVCARVDVEKMTMSGNLDAARKN